MSPDQYKKARSDLGFQVPDWCQKLGISLDTHKSYNSGRREVPLFIQRHIETLLDKKQVVENTGCID